VDAYLKLSPEDQRALCTEGGARRSLQPASMEKDFWVWRANYEQMKEPYFFGAPPTFEEVLGVVGEFEQQFNQQAKA
jgi:hypothetical protein